MNNIKYFICPISINIIDSVLELNYKEFAFAPTRRQIDFDGGYVNEWTTQDFYRYVKDRNKNIVLERDHSGPNQGKISDDGLFSLIDDIKYFNIIHIDIWKDINNFELACKNTLEKIRFINSINSNIKFEIGTEQEIYNMSPEQLDYFINYLNVNLNKSEFNNIEYAVVQSGVKLDLINKKNVGENNFDKLYEYVKIVRKYNLKAKEHNGDYLSNLDISLRFNYGVDAINIGPELAQIETNIYVNHMTETEIDEFYKICLDSNKWKRWINDDFNINNQIQLINLCGHYSYSKFKLPKVDKIVKNNIKEKLKSLPI